MFSHQANNQNEDGLTFTCECPSNRTPSVILKNHRMFPYTNILAAILSLKYNLPDNGDQHTSEEWVQPNMGKTFIVQILQD